MEAFAEEDISLKSILYDNEFSLLETATILRILVNLRNTVNQTEFVDLAVEKMNRSVIVTMLADRWQLNYDTLAKYVVADGSKEIIDALKEYGPKKPWSDLYFRASEQAAISVEVGTWLSIQSSVYEFGTIRAANAAAVSGNRMMLMTLVTHATKETAVLCSTFVCTRALFDERKNLFTPECVEAAFKRKNLLQAAFLLQTGYCTPEPVKLLQYMEGVDVADFLNTYGAMILSLTKSEPVSIEAAMKKKNYGILNMYRYIRAEFLQEHIVLAAKIDLEMFRFVLEMVPEFNTSTWIHVSPFYMSYLMSAKYPVDNTTVDLAIISYNFVLLRYCGQAPLLPKHLMFPNMPDDMVNYLIGQRCPYNDTVRIHAIKQNNHRLLRYCGTRHISNETLILANSLPTTTMETLRMLLSDHVYDRSVVLTDARLYSVYFRAQLKFKIEDLNYAVQYSPVEVFKSMLTLCAPDQMTLMLAEEVGRRDLVLAYLKPTPRAATTEVIRKTPTVPINITDEHILRISRSKGCRPEILREMMNGREYRREVVLFSQSWFEIYRRINYPFTSEDLDYVVQTSSVPVEIFRQLLRECQATPKTLRLAIAADQLSNVEKLMNLNCPCDLECHIQAVDTIYAEKLAKKYPFDSSLGLCFDTIEENDADMIKLHMSRLDVDDRETMLRYLIEQDRLDLLQSHRMRFELTANTFTYAHRCRAWHCLLYLIDTNCPRPTLPTTPSRYRHLARPLRVSRSRIAVLSLS